MLINTLFRELFNSSNITSFCLTLCILFVIYFLYKFIKYARLYQHVRWKLPGPKLERSIWGMDTERLTEKVLAKWEQRMLAFPKFFRVVYGPVATIEVVDPECVQIVLNSGSPKGQAFKYMVSPWLGESLLLSEGSYWKRNRRLLTPTFYNQCLRKFVRIMNRSSDRLVRILNRDLNKQILFTPVIHKMTLEVILNCICSKDIDLQCQIDPNTPEFQYQIGIDKISAGFVQRFANFLEFFDLYFYRKKPGKEFLKGIQITKQYFLSLIKERETQLNDQTNQNESNFDMLDLLMRSRDDKGNGLTQKEIIDELNTFIFAGHESTAVAITFSVYFLGKYPEIQSRCRQEILTVLNGRNDLEYDYLSQLTYLTCFIKESLRYFSPIMFIQKQLHKPITLDGYEIPASLNVDIPIQLLHWNPTIWENPKQFDPNRFSEENASTIHPYAFIPFSAGPRNCIGQNFALTELKISLVSLLRHFQISLLDGYEMERELTIVWAPVDGFPVIFTPL